MAHTDTFDAWRTQRLTALPRPCRLVLTANRYDCSVRAELINATARQLNAFHRVLFATLTEAEQTRHVRGFNVSLEGPVRLISYDAFDRAQARGIVLGAVYAATHCAKRT